MMHRPFFNLHLAVVSGKYGCRISGFPEQSSRAFATDSCEHHGWGMAAASDSAKLQRHPSGSNSILVWVIPGGPGFDLLLQPFSYVESP